MAAGWRIAVPDDLALGAEAHHLIVVRGGDDPSFAAALRTDHVTEHQLPWRGRKTRTFVVHWEYLDLSDEAPELRMAQEADGQPSMALLVVKLNNMKIFVQETILMSENETNLIAPSADVRRILTKARLS